MSNFHSRIHYRMRTCFANLTHIRNWIADHEGLHCTQKKLSSIKCPFNRWKKSGFPFWSKQTLPLQSQCPFALFAVIVCFWWLIMCFQWPQSNSESLFELGTLSMNCVWCTCLCSQPFSVRCLCSSVARDLYVSISPVSIVYRLPKSVGMIH